MDNRIRLQKYLSEIGVASRRKAEDLIRDGHVKVNGRTAHIGDSVDPRNDTVLVNGRRVKREVELKYFLLNKPRGFVTTTDDELGRKCVTELFSDIPERLYPVGRLDKVSEGALIMTNDGAFTNKITHPSNHVPKTYRVTLRNEITKEQVRRLEDGIELDGKLTAPAEVHVILKETDRSVVEIILHEGRNRQIRRMCEALELEVIRLKRTAIGNVQLGKLPVGHYRELTEKEINSLVGKSGDKK